MTHPADPDPAALAARHGLVRSYAQVLGFVRQRAAGGDVVALGFERALSHLYLPAPTRLAVKRWLAQVAAEPRLFNRASDPWVAQRLQAELQAVEARAPGITEMVWAEVVASARAGDRP